MATWKKLWPKFVVIGVFAVVALLMYAFAGAATFKDANITPSGEFLYTLEMDGKNVYCIEPKAGQKTVLCWDDNKDLFECEVLSSDAGFLGVCT